ncbi:hypothetical protein [Streptomyces sp. AcH 505]|uniref:hypothetical protein n=1 Tax=Streptomyces sp. AcH 505 TaxID=352211 RepID=UPI0012FF41B6
MATLTPPPSPTEPGLPGPPTNAPSDPTPVPTSPEGPAAPVAPSCALCGADAVVHWQRRLDDVELDYEVGLERLRRAGIAELADPQLPTPTFPPLPGSDDFVRPVHACAAHAITLDAATQIHQSHCTAPNEVDLTGCDCTPEPLPPAEPRAAAPAPVVLPDHWIVGEL